MYHGTGTDISGLNTFGVAAKAREYYRLDSIEDLESLFLKGILSDPQLLVLGGGSNLLFVADPPAVVIHPAFKGISYQHIKKPGVKVTCAAGEVWDDLVEATVNAGLYGLENLSLIPGSVGAAPVQNIGAYGTELVDHLLSLRAFDLQTGGWKDFTAAECEFGYRSSIFKTDMKHRMLITEVSLVLSKKGNVNIAYGNLQDELEIMQVTKPDPRSVREAVIRVRRSKLPDPAILGNAGSFFKNPSVDEDKAAELAAGFPQMPAYPQPNGKVKLAAGWLIEKAGWKGYREGNVGVHERQALVIVNHGGASGTEVLHLARKIRQSVHQHFGIWLEPEVNFVGASIDE